MEALISLVQKTDRRSANYKPNIWKHDFLQTLSSSFNEEEYVREAEKLKGEVQKLLNETVDLCGKLELVDCIRKLGLGNYFEDEVKKVIDTIKASFDLNLEQDLYITSLRFKLLRLHGYDVSQDVFKNFIHETGISSKSKKWDIASIIQLLEVSHLAQEGESVLEDAKTFSTRFLKEIEYSTTTESKILKHVRHSLELPSHWRSEWFDVKWQIDKYEQDKNISNCVIDLAKVNFNIVQSTLQKDLKDISRWWQNLGLIENMNFSRDRLVESFLCTIGLVFEPKHKSFRRWLTKVILMIIVIDDVYDVYGSLDELQIFTNAVNRWEFRGELQHLPECMQICLQALYNLTNEISHEIHREKGLDYATTQTHLKKVWGDFCESLLVEAKWFNKGETPSLEEYLNNAWISSSGSLLSVHSFFCIMSQVSQDAMDFLGGNQDLIHNISLIIRLCNDLATSMAEQERGDAASSIVCYMREMNASEEASRNHIKNMINDLWKKINGKCFTNIDDQMQLFVKISINMARVAHNLYQNGDGFGAQGHENKKQILSLLVNPLNID
ncbi:Alpha-farnesene synthase [Euphorbia peplus]|nr:Alpha-farnesene synthase [Euphorbia peplus]